MKRTIFLSVILALAPASAFAATTVTGTNLEGIINAMIPLFVGITRILDAVALLGFFWGVQMFIWNAGDEKKRAQGKYVMLWGIIALFFLVSIAGILGILQTTFGLGDNPTIVPPSADPGQYHIGG